MSPRIKRFTFCWLPLIAYCLLIYIQSDHPTPESLPTFEFSDKLLHFAAYAVLGVLFYRAYQTLSQINHIHFLMLLSIISASLYGVSDEIHQAFVPARDAQLSDVIADILGAVCGVYLFNWWKMVRKDRVLKSE